jgi:membrane associated rhomboid family serine protease
MTNLTFPGTDPLEVILRLCAAEAPRPWYPRRYAEETGVSRDSLDPHLERLRLGGLIQLTEWVEGQGQGYLLTPGGRRALQNPRDLDRLRGDKPILPNGAPKPAWRPREGDPTTYERGELVREALLSPPNPVIGRAILAVNVLVFLFGFYLAHQRGLALDVYLHWNPIASIQGADAQKYNEIIHDQGGLNGFDYLDGTWWWRLVTCTLVHVGILHIGMNMLALYRGGPIIESMYGRVRFLVIYLFAGIGGSCFALVWSPAGCVGASGALCGIFAAEAAWVFLNRRFLPPQLVSLWRSNLLQNLFLIVFISLLPGVSGAGHLGGAVVGVTVAVLLHYQRFGRGLWRLAALVGAAVIPVVCVAAVPQAVRVNPRWGDVLAERERRQMNEDILPTVTNAGKEAEAAYLKQIRPLWKKHSTRRTQEEIQAASTKIEELHKDLSDVAERLRRAGPYRTSRIEEGRQIKLQLVEAWIELLDLSQRCLNEKDNKEDDLLRQEVQVSDLQARWNKLAN